MTPIQPQLSHLFLLVELLEEKLLLINLERKQSKGGGRSRGKAEEEVSSFQRVSLVEKWMERKVIAERKALFAAIETKSRRDQDALFCAVEVEDYTDSDQFFGLRRSKWAPLSGRMWPLVGNGRTQQSDPCQQNSSTQQL